MSAEAERRKAIVFAVLVAAVLLLPWLGPGPVIVAVVLGGALLGVPLFALIGTIAIACFLLWPNNEDPWVDLSTLVERINGLADNENLLAVPLFMLSGSIMARGEISSRLIDVSKALIGWVPGGLAVSGVVACMLFAAISGSSPATVVAIGAMMAPTLIQSGYPAPFSHGLLTASGSLGILIPPSIPMILYPLIYPHGNVETSRLFAAGFGPGLLIGGLLAAYCIYVGVTSKAVRQAFTFPRLLAAGVDGFWSLLFPIVILGGLYTGFFTVVEAAAVSVVYALVVELFIHRALERREIPGIVRDTGVIVGSLLVIMVAALAFSEFLHVKHVPNAAVEVIQSWNLSPLAFLIILNVLLLLVGALMDILSAMFLFVPLLAPIAASMGVDPMHFGIIFIVNLEIGYLTPPVGLNLFVASTLFEKPIGYMVRSVLPFIAVMVVGLGVVTYVPALSVGVSDWLTGEASAPPRTTPEPIDDLEDLEPLEDETLPDDDAEPGEGDGVQTMEEMMRELDALDEDAEGEDGADPIDTTVPTEAEQEDPDHVMTMEEMMEAAGE